MALIEYNFGIDFGTTNSSVMQSSRLGDHTIQTPYGDEEGRPVPSLVAINRQTDEVFTGREAWNRRSELADDCEIIHSVKSLMDERGWQISTAKSTWTAKRVASEVFRALKNVVENSDLNEDLEMRSATIAVPIGADATKRCEIRAAAKAVGLEVKSFVSEPTAAFFANFDELRSCENVVIFDWGGGTLDVSILSNKNGRITELATVGMNVAGDAIDELLARRIHAKVAREKNRKDLGFDDMPASARDMLLVRAERAKRALSEDDDTVVALNRYGDLGAFRVRVQYEWFDEIVAGVVEDAMKCLEEALVQAEKRTSTIDRIVMVGGSSSLGPLLDRMVEKYGEELLYFPEETVWSISEGAAILSQHPGKYLAAQDVSIVLADGSKMQLLKTGDVVEGWSKSITLGIVDTSEEVHVVFSGSRDIDDSGDRYRSIEVPSYRFLQETVELKAEITEDLIFRVSLKSRMRSRGNVWEYGKLKLSYSIPELGL